MNWPVMCLGANTALKVLNGNRKTVLAKDAALVDKSAAKRPPASMHACTGGPGVHGHIHGREGRQAFERTDVNTKDRGA